MADRADLNKFLEDLMENENVYFNPPESIKLEYPAIVYKLDNYDVKHANNKVYIAKPGYEVTLIDKDPDSIYFDKLLLSISNIIFLRQYTSDGLHHWVFRLYQD